MSRTRLVLLTALLFTAASFSSENLYVGSFFDSAIYQLDPATGAVLTTLVAPNSQATLQGIGDIAVGPDGNLYMTSNFNNSIVKYDLTSSTLSTFINSSVLNDIAGQIGTPNFSPTGLRFGPDGNLYVCLSGGQSANGGGTVIRFNINGGVSNLSYSGINAAIATGLVQPQRLAFGRTVDDVANLYVSAANGKILKLNQATSAAPSAAVWIDSGSGGLNYPTGLLFDTTGNLFVIDSGATNGQGQILQFDAAGTFFKIFSSPASALLNQLPQSATFTDDGRLLTANLGVNYPAAFGGPGTNGSASAFDSTGAFAQNLTATSFPANQNSVTNISPNAITTLKRPPLVLTQPQSIATNAGNNATFTAAASGGLPSTLSVKWQIRVAGQSFTDLTDSGIYSGTQTGTLKITTVSPNLNATFRAIFNSTENLPAVSAEADLIVYKPTTVYIDSSFASTAYAQRPATTPTSLAPIPVRAGIEAFSTIASALDNVVENGTVIVFANSTGYDGFTLAAPLQSFTVSQNPQSPNSGNTVTINTAVTLMQSLAIDQTDASIAFNAPIGEIGGSFGLIKNGAQNLITNATHTYTGSTTVNSGTLICGGTLAGAVSMGLNAKFSPGNTNSSTFTANSDFTWNGSDDASATALFSLDTASTNADALAIAGAFTKGSGSTFQFDFGGTGLKSNEYLLATFASTTFTAADFSAINTPNNRAAIFTLSATDLRVKFNTPPAFTSQLSFLPAAPKAGETVTFNIVADDADNDPLTTTYVYGDGTSGTSAAHVYILPGTFTVSVTISDDIVSISDSTTVVVITSNPFDTDGDGFTDTLEIAANSDPLSAASTPNQILALSTPKSFTLIKALSVSLHFKGKPGADKIKLTATLPLPAGVDPKTAKLIVNIGGTSAVFTLVKGKAKVVKSTAALSTKGVLTVALAGTFASQFADRGLTNDPTLKKAPRPLDVALILGTSFFKQIQPTKYTVTKSGVGTAKK